MKNKGLLGLCLLGSTWVGSRAENILSLQGSGTTNPSKCFWNILDKLEAQSSMPLHLRYRAVGSSTGIEELINNVAKDAPVAFVSGDIPISSDDYANLTSNGIDVLHLPVLLGAVSVFHSVPAQLNLTACLLARIFTRDITRWGDEAILEMNPDLKDNLKNLDITVAVRLLGSSSTASFTEYLSVACPDYFPEELSSSLPEWPDEHKRCDGSAAMTECIREVEGTIGYLEAGHGTEAGLDEIELQNDAGTWMNSTVASDRGGILAAESGVFPSSPTADFGEVVLVNRPGENTWPITLMSYIMVRQDISYIKDPMEQSLLVAFLKTLVDEEYIGVCRDEFGFTLPSEETTALARAAIDIMESSLNASAVPWLFEGSTTLPIEGAGPYVFSAKRESSVHVQLEALESMVADLQSQIDELSEMVTSSTTRTTEDSSTSSGETLSITFLSVMSFIWWMGYFFMTAGPIKH